MIRKLNRNEEGFAMAAVALLGLFLIMLSVVMITRSQSTQDIVATDRAWEQSLHTAESGIDYALAEFASEPEFSTTPTLAEVDTRQEVIAAAIALAKDPLHAAYDQAVHESGEGLSVIIKPSDADVVYGVGFSPSLESYERGEGTVRIIVSDLNPPYWTPQQAILVGGPIKLEAKKGDKDIDLTCSEGAGVDCTGGGGWIHSNGKIEFKVDKHENNITGCFTAFGLEDVITKDNGDPRKTKDTVGPYTNNDPSAYAGCATISEQELPMGTHVLNSKVPFIPVPEIDPMALHDIAQYEVCPDGLRWGPNAHTSEHYPGTETSGPAKSKPTLPCTGDWITYPIIDDWVLGLKNGDKDDQPGTETWDKRVEFTGITEDGIYFLWGHSAKVKKVKGDVDHFWTIIGSHGDALHPSLGPLRNDLKCYGKDDGVTIWNPKDAKWEDTKNETFGDIEVEVENDDLYPYGWDPDTGTAEDPGEGRGYLFVTAGDLKIKVKGKKDLPDPGDIHGIMAAHEQIRVESSDADEGKGAIYGAIIAQDACDTKDSLHHDKMSEFKKGDIIYNGGFAATDFVIADTNTGEFRIEDQNEF